MNLLNKKYPVKNAETDEIVGYRTITKFQHLQNVAGVVIYLDNNESPIMINYVEANKIDKEQDKIPDNCLDK